MKNCTKTFTFIAEQLIFNSTEIIPGCYCPLAPATPNIIAHQSFVSFHTAHIMQFIIAALEFLPFP